MKRVGNIYFMISLVEKSGMRSPYTYSWKDNDNVLHVVPHKSSKDQTLQTMDPLHSGS